MKILLTGAVDRNNTRNVEYQQANQIHLLVFQGYFHIASLSFLPTRIIIFSIVKFDICFSL